jgi:hypothetical protein
LDQLYTNPKIWTQNEEIDNQDDFYRKFNELKKDKNKTTSLANSPLTNSTLDSDNSVNIVNKKKPMYHKQIPEKNYLFSSQMDVIRNQILNSIFEENKINGNKYQSSTNDDNYYMININNIMQRLDERTTIMIRHIPNKYNMLSFLEEVNKDFKDKYDIFYLPVDFKNNCNLGFAFINFIDPMHIILFYELFRGKKWTKYKSDKICELAYAKVQGRNELIEHFKKGSILSLSDDKKPIILNATKPLPRISMPLKCLDLFCKYYPYSNYTIDRRSFSVNSFSRFE